MVKSCKYCGAELSEDTLFCPKCGNYIKRKEADKSSPVKWILIAVACMLLVVAAGMLIATNNSKTQTALTMQSDSNLDASNEYVVYLCDENNNTLADKFIVVEINENSYTLMTDENGFASINLTVGEGSYQVNSYFKGDDKYAESHTSDIIIK